jgi:hypothetical protein
MTSCLFSMIREYVWTPFSLIDIPDTIFIIGFLPQELQRQLQSCFDELLTAILNGLFKLFLQTR